MPGVSPSPLSAAVTRNPSSPDSRAPSEGYVLGLTGSGQSLSPRRPLGSLPLLLQGFAQMAPPVCGLPNHLLG